MLKCKSQKLISEIVKRDVENVKKHARIIIYINSPINISLKPKSRLNVLAVIGPGTYNGQIYKEAVKLEVGIGRGKPYHVPSHVKGAWIAARKKWFALDEGQYCLVAPTIFAILNKLSREQIEKRKCNFSNPFWFKVYRPKFLLRKKGIDWREKSVPCLPETRFAVSKKDELLIRDIYQAELNHNTALTNQILSIAKAVDKRLSPFRNKQYKKPFCDLQGFKDAKGYLTNSPLLKRNPHLLPEIRELLRYRLREYPKKIEKNPLWDEIVQHLIPWDGTTITPERQLSCLALPNLTSRLNGSQIQVTTHLDGISKNEKRREWQRERDHIVFALFPA